MSATQCGNAGWVLGNETAEIEDQTPDIEAVKRFLLDHAQSFKGLATLADSIALAVDPAAFELLVAGCHALLGEAFQRMKQADEAL